MKKIFLSFMIILLTSSIFAASITGSAVNKNQGTDDSAEIQTAQQNQGEKSQIKNKIKEGEYTTENGKKLQIMEKTEGGFTLGIGQKSARTSMQISQEEVEGKTKLKTTLSNGKNTEIKIMPDTASETALARLRIKVCSEENNCQIELKEVGQDEQTKVAYEMKAKKQARFLWMFKTQMQVQTQVDAENGEVIQTKKPWWAFLAKEVDEKEIACTKEAKICPDGTAVKREGPDCEFPKCPGETEGQEISIEEVVE